MDRSVVAELAAEWGSIADLLYGLDDKEWDLPTDCPGWTVRDQVSHLIGVESMLLGRPSPPAVDKASAPHANGPMGLVNEAWVAARRDRSPDEMRAEFAEVTAARRAALEAMTDEELAEPTQSPIGEVPYAEFMRVRVMDCWVHEQDIRRAVGQPGGYEGPPAETALARLTGALGFIVGKRAAAPDGASIVVELEGPMARRLAVSMIDGRARPSEPTPAEPTVRLTMSAETFACLTTGRWSSADAFASGRVDVTGDRELAQRIVQGMSVIT